MYIQKLKISGEYVPFVLPIHIQYLLNFYMMLKLIMQIQIVQLVVSDTSNIRKYVRTES